MLLNLVALLPVLYSVHMTNQDLEWYATLVRPELSPPNWVFGPVWTVLYACMAVVAVRLWNARGKKGMRRKATWALSAFGVQLALNLAWSPLFFGAHMPGVALVDIIAMWVAIVATIVLAARVDRVSAWLLAPYLAWVSFALYLNAAIVVLNP